MGVQRVEPWPEVHRPTVLLFAEMATWATLGAEKIVGWLLEPPRADHGKAFADRPVLRWRSLDRANQLVRAPEPWATVAIARLLTDQVKTDEALAILNEYGNQEGMAPGWRIRMRATIRLVRRA